MNPRALAGRGDDAAEEELEWLTLAYRLAAGVRRGVAVELLPVLLRVTVAANTGFAGAVAESPSSTELSSDGLRPTSSSRKPIISLDASLTGIAVYSRRRPALCVLQTTKAL